MTDLPPGSLLDLALPLAFAGLLLAAAWQVWRMWSARQSPRTPATIDTEEVVAGRLAREMNEDITDSLSVSFFQVRQERDERIWLPYVAGKTERFLPWTQTDLMHRGGGMFPNVLEEDRPRAEAALSNSLAAGTPILLDLRVKRSEGRVGHAFSYAFIAFRYRAFCLGVFPYRVSFGFV